MRGNDLREIAAEIRKKVAADQQTRVKAASAVIDAALAIRLLKNKVRTHA